LASTGSLGRHFHGNIDPRRGFGEQTTTLHHEYNGHANPDPEGTGASRAGPEGETTALVVMHSID